MDFVDRMDFLNKLIKCRLCGSEETRRNGNDEYLWIPDNNRDGAWTGKYLCYDCRYLNNIFCSECERIDRLLYTYDENGLWNGKRVCYGCSKSCKTYNERRKLSAACRNGNLSPKSSVGKGFISEILVAKFLDIRTCFDITGNFNYPGYDLLEHEDWGTINVKSSSLLKNRFHTFGTRKSIKPDFFFCIGYDENRKHVIAVYIIPNEEYVNKLYSIAVPFGKDFGNSKWYEFRESEEEIQKWDELFHTMKLDDCPVLRSDRNDDIDEDDCNIEDDSDLPYDLSNII